jgi:hypothetical protein
LLKTSNDKFENPNPPKKPGFKIQRIQIVPKFKNSGILLKDQKILNPKKTRLHSSKEMC